MPQCFLLDKTYSPKLCILEIILSVIPSSKHCVIVFSLWLVQYWYLMLPPPMDEWERDTKKSHILVHVHGINKKLAHTEKTVL